MKRDMPPALVSIHDVMPSTLGCVDQLVAVARQHEIRKLTLLVVPGCDWTDREVDRLRHWQATGYRLAGHGWHHRCQQIRGLRHRLHSWFLSRDVAEHLSATPDEVVELIRRCRAWFDQRDLDPPALYVPPAWALGRVSRQRLQSIPFRMVETLWGILDVRRSVTLRIPLVGFEADTWTRQQALRGGNVLNRLAASRLNRPLRLALHPHDLHLRMAADARYLLARVETSLDYEDLLQEEATRQTIPDHCDSASGGYGVRLGIRD
jgi:uncharacterized protein